MIDKKEYELYQFALHFNTVTVQAKFDRKIYFISKIKNVLFPGITTFFGIEKYCTIWRENTDDFYFKLYRGKKRVNEQYIMKF